LIPVPAFWHPLSTLIDPAIGTLCSPALIALPLRASGETRVLYAGDRMWPAIDHGQVVELRPVGDAAFSEGEVLAVNRDGSPDLLRLLSREGQRLRLQGDADPGGAIFLDRARVLARVSLPTLGLSERRRRWHRLRIDVSEARQGRVTAAADAAASVRGKYDVQAAFYAAASGARIDASLIERLGRRVARGTRVLVAGSGSGRECFALARAGWRVTGVDFAKRMVEFSKRTAQQQRLPVKFVHSDLRRHDGPAASLAAIVFTFDVYSFLPRLDERVGLLRKMARWIAPSGVILLSARRVRRAYERMILTIQRATGAEAWGDSHTRFIVPDGTLRRSFVHYFTGSRLRRECAAAGLRAGSWHAGHAELSCLPGRAGGARG
jgi:SAM-dependent methyltransferase